MVVVGLIFLQPTLFKFLILALFAFSVAVANAFHARRQYFVKQHKGHAKKGHQHFEPPLVFKRHKTSSHTLGSGNIDVQLKKHKPFEN
jgi:hypothetical protein